MTREQRRLTILRFLLALGALLIAPALARADAATPPAASNAPAAAAPATPAIAPADTMAAALGALQWWDIESMVARFGVAKPPEREIQPFVLHPDEQTRALEFRGAMPNPFHSETAIRFSLPVSAHVSLRVYDVAGKLVRSLVDAQMPPGDHSAMLVAGDMRSGVYFAVLRVGVVTATRSIVLAR